MNDPIIGIRGEQLEWIEVGDDPESAEHCAYRITIKTSDRIFTIRGCHDMGPELEIQ